MDSISWSRGRPHRKSCTFLRRSWCRKAAIDVNTFLRPHLKNWCWKPFSGMLVLLFLLLSMMILIIWFTFLRRSILSFRLQGATRVIAKFDSFNYYKVRWSVSRKWDSYFITKCNRYCKAIGIDLNLFISNFSIRDNVTTPCNDTASKK